MSAADDKSFLPCVPDVFVENDRFVAEVVQVKDWWVAELRYKFTGITERWIAASQDELLLMLLKDKAKLSLRLRRLIANEKLGGRQLDKYYPNIPFEKFRALPAEERASLIESIARPHIDLFLAQTPDFYGTPANVAMLNKFLQDYELPYTVNNLKYAHQSLTDDDLYPDERGNS